MKLKTILALLTTSIFLLACKENLPEKKSGDVERPNIILIMADDLGYETLGINGSEDYLTPNLDLMAQNGMRFTDCHATPLCTPSRIQIMTGKYNFRNYIGFGLLDSNQKTFAHYLKDTGYTTYVAGKWQLLGNEQQRKLAGGKIGSMPEQAGFDDYCLWQVHERGNRFKSPHLTFKDGKSQDFPEKFGPDIFVEQISSFIEHNQERPFMVYYPMALTHDPFVPTPKNSGFAEFDAENFKSDKKFFGEMVSYMDFLVGKIIKKVEDLNLAENTLIIFLGDNGTHRSIVSNWQGKEIKGHKGYTTKAGTHVPLIAYWKGKIAPGKMNNNLIDLSDFLPTLMDVAGGTKMKPGETDGHSFYNQLLDQPGEPRDWVFCDYAPNWGKFKPSRFVHDKTWKLYSDGRFYNLEKDPQELNGLSVDNQSIPVQEIVVQFQKVLDSLQ